MLAEGFAVISYRRFPTTSVRISSYIGGRNAADKLSQAATYGLEPYLVATLALRLV